MKRIVIAAFACSLGIWGVTAQEDDKGFLVNALQGALSGAGRDVQIEGFSGALSSRATMERMTIADEDGIWLTLEDVAA